MIERVFLSSNSMHRDNNTKDISPVFHPLRIVSNPNTPILEHPYDSEQTLIEISEPQARGFLSKERALQLCVLPLMVTYRGSERLLVCCAETRSHELEQTLRFATGFAIELRTASRESLVAAVERLYLGEESILSASVKALSRYDRARVESHTTRVDGVGHSENEVTRFLDTLIEHAIARRASDIHVQPRRDGAHVKLRVNGEFLDHISPIASLEVHRQIVSRLKVMAGLDITQRETAQDGRIRYGIGTREIDLRVSVVPTVYGENLVIRIFGECSVMVLADLGYDAKVLNWINDYIRRMGAGLLVVAGPTGSGKTTSLYSIAQELRTMGKGISTVEDPVEITIDGFVQTSVSARHGFEYADALKAILRQDPDTIIIGELRDPAATQCALDASVSGHHVLSTVHGNRAFDVVRRLRGLKADPSVLLSALSLVISQRLMSRLCRHCRVFDLKAANSIGCDVYQSVGCAACDYSGYKGRIIVAEALLFSDQLRDRLFENSHVTQSVIRDWAGGDLVSFSEHALALLERGDISYGQYVWFGEGG
jgi:type II secretory ATPase GspE/PulE/Tfp pilus assembly ATPase PilB-like protein